MENHNPVNGKIGAFFDVDGTLAASNLVDAYINFQLFDRHPLKKALWLLGLAPKLPYYVVTDALSRRRFNLAFFKNYHGVRSVDLQAWVSLEGKKYWTRRLYPLGLKEIREHQVQGNRVVLVTGGLAIMVKPLKELLSADDCIAAHMTCAGENLTGALTGEPLTDVVKASEVRRVVEEWGLDASGSYAYADSISDTPFLECVGHPVAVNPDHRLRQLAKKRGWDIKTWKTSDLIEPSHGFGNQGGGS